MSARPVTIDAEPWAGAARLEPGAALAWIVSHVAPLEPRRVALADALGLVLAADARATEASPRFNTSAMDGYAARTGEAAVGAPFVVVGAGAAGRPYAGTVLAGEAVRIMTGAVVPSGADVVVPLEHVTHEQGGVTLPPGLRPYANVRRAGEDHWPGDIVVGCGVRLRPAHIAVLASIGHDLPLVVPRVRVGVLSTGDELGGPASEAGSIRDANRPGLLALVAASGYDAVDLGVVADDPAALDERLQRAVDCCDAVLTTGGVSVGDHDHVKHVLASLASRMNGSARWMQVAVRPAKPLMFAVLRGVPLFGLPGNPASAFVSFELFARPALDRLAGHRDEIERLAFIGVAATEFTRSVDGRLHVVPVEARITDDGVVEVLPAVGHGHHLAATAGANAYAHLPDGTGVRRGGAIRCTWTAPAVPMG